LSDGIALLGTLTAPQHAQYYYAENYCPRQPHRADCNYGASATLRRQFEMTNFMFELSMILSNGPFPLIAPMPLL